MKATMPRSSCQRDGRAGRRSMRSVTAAARSGSLLSSPTIQSWMLLWRGGVGMCATRSFRAGAREPGAAASVARATVHGSQAKIPSKTGGNVGRNIAWRHRYCEPRRVKGSAKGAATKGVAGAAGSDPSRPARRSSALGSGAAPMAWEGHTTDGQRVNGVCGSTLAHSR
jgi:hypothetical protein